jgi:hypothetical protein
MSVSKGILVAILAVLIGLAAHRVVRAQADGETLTVKGEIVDLACYLPRGERGRGPAHQECAEMCAKDGAPLGVLDGAGKLLLLVEDHEKPAPYKDAKKLAGQQAEISGKKVDRGGLAGIVVSAAKAQ